MRKEQFSHGAVVADGLKPERNLISVHLEAKGSTSRLLLAVGDGTQRFSRVEWCWEQNGLSASMIDEIGAVVEATLVDALLAAVGLQGRLDV